MVHSPPRDPGRSSANLTHFNDAIEPNKRVMRMTYMLASPFQFRLWHLLLASAVCSVALWLLIAVILPSVAIGSRRDLPRAEQLMVAAIDNAGVSVCDQFT